MHLLTRDGPRYQVVYWNRFSSCGCPQASPQGRSYLNYKPPQGPRPFKKLRLGPRAFKLRLKYIFHKYPWSLGPQKDTPPGKNLAHARPPGLNFYLGGRAGGGEFMSFPGGQNLPLGPWGGEAPLWIFKRRALSEADLVTLD